MADKNRPMFHTQGYSKPPLRQPIICVNETAWLGKAYYFWANEDDAISWGLNSKKNYRTYSIYKANINTEYVLDTVFNEAHYDFWISQLEKAIKSITIKLKRKPGISDVNEYILGKGGWDKSVTGIMFQDLPSNETISKVTGFYYKKRIQLAAFDLKIINNFAHHFDGL